MANIKDEITEVKGIGPATANILAKHGIKTIRDLASASIPQLVAIPGFDEFRAGRVKFNAQSVLKKPVSKEAPDVRSSPTTRRPVKKSVSASLNEKVTRTEKPEKLKKKKKKSKDDEKAKSKLKKKDKSGEKAKRKK